MRTCRVYPPRESCWDFHFLRLSATPGSEQTHPREGLSTPPARRVSHRSPFFLRHLIELLRGAGVEPPRGRGRPSGARESQLFFGYDSPPPRGASGSVVRGRTPLHAPRSPSWARHPFIRRQIIGLCGWAAAPQRGSGRPSGVRESHMFSGGVITKIFPNIQG